MANTKTRNEQRKTGAKTPPARREAPAKGKADFNKKDKES